MRKTPIIVAALLLMTTGGMIKAAESDWEKSLEAAEKAFIDKDESHIDANLEKSLNEAPDDTVRATIQNQIGVIRMGQQRYVDAQKAFQASLDLRIKTAGPADGSTAQAMGNLGLAEHKLGNEVKAEELFKKAIEGKRRVDPTSPSLASALTNLAHLYSEERRCKEAKTLYLEALGIDSTAYGGDHKEVAQDLFNLGALLHRCNSFAEALPYFERSKRTYEAISDEQGKAKALHYIGLCYAAMNQHPKAAEAALAALQAHEKVKGKGHNDPIVHTLNAADALDAAGDRVKAEKLYQQALATAEASKEPSNFRLAECNLELGQFYARRKDPDKAEHFFKKAIAHYDNLSKRERRTIYELPLAYAKFLQDQHRTEESEAISARYIDVFQPTKASAVQQDAPQR